MSEPVGVVCRERPGRAYLNLRGDISDASLRDRVAKVMGVELPGEPCTWKHADGSSAYWLGPDEWLLMAEDGNGSDLATGLREGLGGRFSVADVSGAQVGAELSGADAGKVLQKSSPYDFHPRNFPAGRCVQTVFAKATALVAANEQAFDVVFRRSYADYIRRWIADAAAEYGFRFEGWLERL